MDIQVSLKQTIELVFLKATTYVTGNPFKKKLFIKSVIWGIKSWCLNLDIWPWNVQSGHYLCSLLPRIKACFNLDGVPIDQTGCAQIAKIS